MGVTGSTLNLLSATVARNFAGLNSSGGGIYNYPGGTVNFRNTIVGDNHHLLIVPDDCFGTLNSQDYNLIETASGCTTVGAITHNMTGMGPLLGLLQNNGGGTLTHALRAGSPAIDAGNPSGCTSLTGAVLTADQRGKKRPADGDRNGTAICDSGAYEFHLQTFLPVVLR